MNHAGQICRLSAGCPRRIRQLPKKMRTGGEIALTKIRISTLRIESRRLSRPVISPPARTRQSKGRVKAGVPVGIAAAGPSASSGGSAVPGRRCSSPSPTFSMPTMRVASGIFTDSGNVSRGAWKLDDQARHASFPCGVVGPRRAAGGQGMAVPGVVRARRLGQPELPAARHRGRSWGVLGKRGLAIFRVRRVWLTRDGMDLVLEGLSESDRRLMRVPPERWVSWRARRWKLVRNPEGPVSGRWDSKCRCVFAETRGASRRLKSWRLES